MEPQELDPLKVNGMSDLVEIAILAYRNGRFRDAIELLVQVQEHEKDNWLAKLYLAICYEKAGRVSDAHRIYEKIVAQCTDNHITLKARKALPLVEAEMTRRFELNGSKNSIYVAADEEDDTSEVG
jgi:tetratricopeptide (TPR) repeat protein